MQEQKLTKLELELPASTPVDGTAATTYNVAEYTAAWTDQATARKAVRFERRLELAMEGQRFFDLKAMGGTSWRRSMPMWPKKP